MKKNITYIIVIICLLSCSINDTTLSESEIISLKIYDELGTTEITKTLADATSVVTLKASIDPNADDTIRTITFNKSEGNFLGVAGATAERQIIDGVASMKLQVIQEIKPLFFTAAVSKDNITYIAENNINLESANPDEIVIEPSNVNINQGDNVDLTIILIRNSGKVSIGTTAIYEATQIDPNTNSPINVGRFTNTTQASTADEKIKNVVFHTDTGNFISNVPITVKISTKNDADETILSSINITLN